jgi:CheY-like chemotaxis protein
LLILLRAWTDPAKVSAILVVDDDPSVRFVVRLVLEREGHEVREAAHGEAALKLMRPDSLPDLVTTDLMMPVLGGVELIQRLRSEPRTARIPIVVISGSPEAARALQSSGLVEAIVDKPFDAIALAQCIRDAADRAARPEVDDSPAIAS